MDKKKKKEKKSKERKTTRNNRGQQYWLSCAGLGIDESGNKLKQNSEKLGPRTLKLEFLYELLTQKTTHTFNSLNKTFIYQTNKQEAIKKA